MGAGRKVLRKLAGDRELGKVGGRKTKKDGEVDFGGKAETIFNLCCIIVSCTEG